MTLPIGTMPDDSVLAGERPNFKDYFSYKFTGEGHDASEAESHLRDFSLYCEAHKATLLSDKLTLFRRTIAGKAKSWFDTASFSSESKLKSEFLKKFGKHKTQSTFVKDFYYSKLQDGEDVESFARKIKEAASGLGITKPETIKDNFLRGLPGHVFNALVLHRGEVLDKLIELATDYLEYVSESRGSVGFESKESVNNVSGQLVAGSRDVLREEREMGLVKKIEQLQARLDKIDRQGSHLGYEDSSSDSEEVNFTRGSRRDNFRQSRRFSSRYPSRDDEYRGRQGHPGRRPHHQSKSPSRSRFHSRDSSNDSRHYRSSHYDSRGRDSYSDKYRRDDSRGRYSVSRDLSRDKHQSRRYDGQSRRDVVCHRCSKPGHIARFCRTNLDENTSVLTQDFH